MERNFELESKFRCSECKSVYSYNRNLRRHVKKSHPNKMSDIAPILNNKKTFKHKCDICGKRFNHSYNFRYHQRKIHNLKMDLCSGRRLENLRCPLCSEVYSLKKHLFSHFEAVHNISINIENLQFQSFKEFITWKENIERETLSKYIKGHGSTGHKGNIKHYYVCHRSGHYIPEIKRQRKLKSQGSQKINGICPASLSVLEADRGVSIKYISTHVGHELDIDHLYLTASEKEQLASHIANKIPFQTIIQETCKQSKYTKSRINRLNRKDLYNIQKRFLMPKKVSSQSCTESFESVIKEIDLNKTSILYYKLPNTVDAKYPNLNSIDFVLILMSDWQCNILKNHGSNLICVDRTNELDVNGFELVTVITLDDYRQAYPSTFLITNRCDQYVFYLYFDCVKSRTGIISTSVFMSTMEESIYNAWVSVMDEPKLNYYSTWDVQEKWDKNLSKIINIDKQNKVLKSLKEFLFERDIDGSEIKLRILIQQLIEDSETIEFGRYLNELFLKSIASWALCYRFKNVIENNTNLERMHGTLKHLFISNENGKQFNLTINTVNNFVSTILLNDFVNLQQDEITFINKEFEVGHETGYRSLKGSLICEVEGGWKIQSIVDPSDVQIIKPHIFSCNCRLKCFKCNVCVHRYVCTCLESYNLWKMCLHIHLMCTYLSLHENNGSVKLFLAEETFSIPFESEVVIGENGEILVQVNENGCREIKDVIALESESRDLVESDKELVKQDFITLVDNISNEDQLEIVRDSVSTMKALLSSTQAQAICVASNELALSSSRDDNNDLQDL